MRKKDEMMKESLLLYAQGIVNTAGVEGVTIRTIAKMAGVATGTVYNYFSSKEELLLALTKDCWEQALEEMEAVVGKGPFYTQAEEMYLFLRSRLHGPAGSLMHKLGNTETSLHEPMKEVMASLAGLIQERIEADEQISKEIWKGDFTKNQYAQFIVRNMMLLLREDVEHLGFFMELIKRTLYKQVAVQDDMAFGRKGEEDGKTTKG